MLPVRAQLYRWAGVRRVAAVAGWAKMLHENIAAAKLKHKRLIILFICRLLCRALIPGKFKIFMHKNGV